MLTSAWILYFVIWILSLVFFEQLVKGISKVPLIMIGAFSLAVCSYIAIADTRVFLLVALATIMSAVGASRTYMSIK